MKKLLVLSAAIVALAVSANASAQGYENIYRSSEVSILQLQGINHTEQMLKGATVMLPNGSNQLTISLHIPYEIFSSQPAASDDPLTPGYQFLLKINIDPVQIQDALTSTQKFCTQGFLTLNSVTKTVKLCYIPVVSGTDENGNFKIFLNAQFNAADFSLAVPDSSNMFIIKINNAKVNRL